MKIFLLSLSIASAFFSCVQDKLPFGSQCEEDFECFKGLCIENICRDPDADEDGDGLKNSEEHKIGTNILNRDSDHDGVDDGEEFGTGKEAADYDEDGIVDALEGMITDSDGDCLPDQFDPENFKYGENRHLLALYGCKHEGVCGKGKEVITAACQHEGAILREIICDYSAVLGYESEESLCDNLDNDCDGLVDENSFYDGKGVGELCYGRGVCGLGYVECSLEGFHATCSTNPDGSASQAKVEICDSLDNDCDGVPDNQILYKGLPPGSICDGEGECGLGVVECGPDGNAICSSERGGSSDQSSADICDNKDNDCNGLTDDKAVFNPIEANCLMKGVCSEYAGEIKGECLAGKWVCDYSAIPNFESPSEKSCDGLDNNCNGVIDEDFFYKAKEGSLLKIGAFCGEGACEGGYVVCSGLKTSAVCSTDFLAKPEECDSIDNDCDGMTDSGLKKDFENKAVKISDGSPSVRKSPGLVYAEEENSIYLFGGATRTDKNLNSIQQANDLWKYSLSDGIWTLIFSNGETPEPREGGLLFLNPSDKKLFLFGGVSVKGGDKKTLWDFYEFDLSESQWHFKGKVENAPEVEKPVYLRKLGGALFVYGLNPFTGKEIFLSVDPDTFEIKSLKTNPAGLKEMSPLLDASNNIIYFSGGTDGTGAISKKVFSYDIGADTWKELSVKNSPPARKDAALILDPSGTVMFKFGGVDQFGNLSDETWSLNLPTGQWSLEPLSPLPPPLKEAVFLNVGEYGILIYGMLANGRINREIWHFNLLSPAWMKDLAPVMPADRFHAAQVYSAKRRAWYLIGGMRSEINEYVPLATIAKYSVEEGVWTEKPLKTDGIFFIGSAAAIDAANDTVYIHGGVKSYEKSGAEGYSGKLFQISLIDYSVIEIPADGDVPQPRAFHTMDYREKDKSLTLYGGLGINSEFNDLLIYETEKKEWKQVGTAGEKGRFGHGSAIDALKDILIIYGGFERGSPLLVNLDNFGWVETELPEESEVLEPVFIYDYFSSTLLVSGKSELFFHIDLTDPWLPKYSQVTLVSEKPLPLFTHSVFDPIKRRGLIFGGMDSNGNSVNAFYWIDQTCPVSE